MKAASALVALTLTAVRAVPVVDERYPYTGPAVPIYDWVDPTINGNGKGFPRLVEPPAVKPSAAKPTNNINVISLSYIPDGIHIHYQTPFGLGVAPSVQWGEDSNFLDQRSEGLTRTYVLFAQIHHNTHLHASRAAMTVPHPVPRSSSPSAVNTSTKSSSPTWNPTPHTTTGSLPLTAPPPLTC